MVQLLNTDMTLCPEKLSVKRESDDSIEDEHGQLRKRFQPDFHQCTSSPDTFAETSTNYNPLEEPSPLGLTLRKSPSLLDLIQMKLSKGSASKAGVSMDKSFDSMVKTESRDASMFSSTEKLKASNFPASLLKIGCWEYISKYEGDLVAKCYYAKHKLVWEILEGGLKSKIEIQWSDIMALKANFPDDAPATLNLVLSRQPLFFRETNPQPRKHTIWQAAVDFTDGEASSQRQHFLQCPHGLLNKHFEKLIQCDPRLNFLSQQPEIVLGSPYFEERSCIFESSGKANIHKLEKADNENRSSFSAFEDVASPSTTSPLKVEQVSHVVLERCSLEASSSSSGNKATEVANRKTPRNWEQMIKVSGLHPSMSMSDLVNHIGNQITEQITSVNNLPFINNGSDYQDLLNEIATYLLSDNQLTSSSDEASLMSRVDSLCCLLQKEPTAVQNSQTRGEGCVKGPHYEKDSRLGDADAAALLIDERKTRLKETKDGSKQAPEMSRKDSFADFLLHLPRIASLPKFLFNISEDDKSQDK